MTTQSVYIKQQREIDRLEAEILAGNHRQVLQAAIIESRDRRIADLETEVSDLETIAEAVETHCLPRDGEEAYGWLMAQAVKELAEERDRLVRALYMVGNVELLAQCPCCLAERTNGEHHDADCALGAGVED